MGSIYITYIRINNIDLRLTHLFIFRIFQKLFNGDLEIMN